MLPGWYEVYNLQGSRELLCTNRGTMKEEDQGSINGVDPTIKFGGVLGPFITKTEVDQRGKRCKIEFRIMRSEVWKNNDA